MRIGEESLEMILPKKIRWMGLAVVFVLLLFSGAEAQQCSRTVVADVVAFDQPIFFNRLGAFNPVGMMYALRRDVIDKRTGTPEGVRNNAGQAGVLTPGFVQLRPDKRPRPIVLRVNAGDCLQINFTNLLNPVPVVANVNGLQVDEQPVTRQAGIHVNGMQLVNSILSDGSNVGLNSQTSPGPSGYNGLVSPGASITYTLYAEFENTYLLYNMGSTTGAEGLGGTMGFGLFGGVNVEPRGSEWYRSQVTREEMDLAAIGRTADGHPILNYDARYPNQEPFISEGKIRNRTGIPILKMLDGNRIVHSDLDAIITGPNRGNFQPGSHYPSTPVNPNQEQPFREFTAIFHDESFALQAFPEFYDDPALKHTLHGVKDFLGINYSMAGIGSEIIANRLGLGPMWDCNECKYEEFFLTSWVVADPGMVVDVPANAGPVIGGVRQRGPLATVALYPDDPAAVHHSYLNDHVKIRNLHAGPFEHHMFHLHAHQWVFSPMNDSSSYLDGQAIGPGSGYTYDIAFGGSGNRNKTPGDAIFHCHFYPHFAQGMWAFWRNHDVFENGTRLEVQFNPRLRNGGRAPFALGNARPAPGSRALPDGEIAAGTPIPAVVPIPGLPMAPIPGGATVKALPGLPGSQIVITEPDADHDGIPDRNPGFPFFIAGIAGHRPPTPPLDIIDDGGLPRHIIIGPTGANNPLNGMINEVHTRIDFSKEILDADALEIPEEGTPVEKAAMSFHAKKFHNTFKPDGAPAQFRTNGLPPKPGAPYADPCVDDSGNMIKTGVTPFFFGKTSQTPTNVQFDADNPRIYKGVNIQIDAIFNKVGWHHPQQRIITLWEDVLPTMTGQRPPEPFIMRLNTLDCAEYRHTNLIPSLYELDDYQVRTPTDIIGQHIHLVKFDVTSSDGSGNGFNYEDGTFSPDEVRERIHAINESGGLIPYAGGDRIQLAAKAHPFFGAGPNNRWLGARTTVQRWFADPILDRQGRDRTIGVVFTHDHFGPSTHQQVGLYGTLLVEPAGSSWVHNETGVPLATRHDGGPTSWQAAILGGNNYLDGPGFREFFFEWGDFQHAYRADWNGVIDSDSYLYAINPSFRVEAENATAADPGDIMQFPAVCPDGVNLRPCPEAISVSDIGTFVQNYRNEPVGLRIFDPDKINPRTGRPGAQADGLAGDLSYVFSSSPTITRKITELNQLMPASVRDSTVEPHFFTGLDTGYTIGSPLPGPQLTADVGTHDPATPIARVYEGDKIRIRVQTGATEESHNVSIHGLKWLQGFANPSSGWRNSQHMGIDEQFQLRTPIIADKGQLGESADYLYSVSSSAEGYWMGAWGLIRSYASQRPDLFALPNNRIGQGNVIINLGDFINPGDFRGVCPVVAPARHFDITAVRAEDVLPVDPILEIPTLVYNHRPTIIPGFGLLEGGSGPLHDPTALMYVLTDDLDETTGRLKPGVPIEPLILRANAGDCIEITLRNNLPVEVPDLPGWKHLPPILDIEAAQPDKVTFNMNDMVPSSHAGLHAQLLEYDITRGDGANVGRNPIQTAPPGGVKFYRWYAGDISARQVLGNNYRLVATPVEFGGVGLMPADKIEQAEKGLVGGLVILPQGATWVEDPGTRASATVSVGQASFRDFVVILHTGAQFRYADNTPVPMMGGEGRVAEDAEDTGSKSINYKSEPAWYRLGFPPHLPFEQQRNFFTQNLYSNAQLIPPQDPQTPVFVATAKTPVRFHFIQPTGLGGRNAVLALHGHLWDRAPYNSNPAIGGPDRIANNPTSQRIGAQEGVGPTSHYDVVPRNGAGGLFGITGDYLYRMMDSGKNYDGMWGIFRVE